MTFDFSYECSLVTRYVQALLACREVCKNETSLNFYCGILCAWIHGQPVRITADLDSKWEGTPPADIYTNITTGVIEHAIVVLERRRAEARA